ncbi:apolipoprotein L3-like [Grammomys surdaster]|uniref:apolipoprotein L3-like n=1 Tax=Grammomys surdaster TaxID=491861 RepID=UPI00109FA570|nr:apolipoprotein L3-like [Grammomys surdaster]XP_028634742.1 apolipoprotein L3-like [Grammomys surdaster]XP_028634743.1 apolipoprotein L3-like [Grammomys surdaster]
MDAVRFLGRVVEELTDFLTEVLCRTDLKSLITEDGVWNGFVEAAELSSEEEAALREALKEHLAQEPTDEDDRPQREQQKERFLQEFPELKKKLEDHIRKLRDLADHLDKVNKDCTISNVVSSSVGTTSGVLGLLGLALAPFTAGTSLVLSVTSVGLGAAASVTSLTTTIVEESNRVSDESEASRLVGASMSILEEILKIVPKITVKLCNTGLELFNAFKTLKDQIRAIRAARSTSSSGAAASNLTSTAQRLLPMTRRARIRSGVFTALFLGLDVYHLVDDSRDLYKGAKTESARALRDLALNLEENLQVFQEFYNALKSALHQ